MKEDAIEKLLEGMPQPKKTKRVVRKKHFNTKNVPLDIAVKRLVAEEIGDVEPTRDEKFVLLQKYGVVAPRIDRQVTRPLWMGESEWKRKQNNWFKMTQGLTRRYQSPRQRPNSQSKPYQKPPFQRAPNPSLRKKFRTDQRPTTRNFRPNSAPTRMGSSQN